MDYTTAVHEAGHAVAAETLGIEWAFHRGTETTDYVARIRTYPTKWQWEDHVLISLSGPFATVGLGDTISEDYHWDLVNHLNVKIKDDLERQAEQLTYDNWSRITDLADEFMAGVHG